MEKVPSIFNPESKRRSGNDQVWGEAKPLIRCEYDVVIDRCMETRLIAPVNLDKLIPRPVFAGLDFIAREANVLEKRLNKLPHIWIPEKHKNSTALFEASTPIIRTVISRIH